MAKTKKFPRFVVHKHNASHLHYDLRLEINDVLVSWAVPKGVPTKLHTKHLAIKQPDHPLSYINFQGVIEEGYGAGTVEIWDEGNFKNVKNEPLEESVKDGKIELEFYGKKLKENYALIKSHLKKGSSSKQDTWLLFKISKKNKSAYVKTSTDKKIKNKKSVRQRRRKSKT